MGGDAGAGVEVVEHQVVGAGWVGQVRAGAGTGLPVPVPAPGQAVVPQVVVGAGTATLVRQELLVAAAVPNSQLAAATTAEMILHLDVSTHSFPDSGLRAGLRHDGGNRPGADL